MNMKNFFLVIGISAGVILLFLIMGYLMMRRIANVVIQSNFDKRYDDRHTLKYFTADDFEHLETEPIEFPSDRGQKLKGFLYRSSLFEEYKALMVVSHGLGAGHLQYTTEIDFFAQKGYLVFAFDDTGCNLSEGEKINGLTQSLIDLDYALRFIRENDRLKDYRIVLFGHSMGAYAVSNVTSLYSDPISGIVALAPFKDEVSFLFEEFRALTNLKYKTVERLLKKRVYARFGEFAKINTVDSFEQSEIPHLIIAGDQDPIVDYYSNFEMLKERFEEKSGYRFLSVENRFHRPNLSLEAAEYDQNTNVELQNIQGKKISQESKDLAVKEFYENLDYHLLVQMDDQVMEAILEFLDDCLKSEKEAN